MLTHLDAAAAAAAADDDDGPSITCDSYNQRSSLQRETQNSTQPK